MACDNYDDIIHLPHHTSPTRPQMAPIDRAAQFSSFAALTGHDEAIKETARRTNERTDLSESAKIVLDRKLQILMDKLCDEPEITVTFFKPDERKSGSAYVDHTGRVKKIDACERVIIFSDGVVISVNDVYEIDSDIFFGLC